MILELEFAEATVTPDGDAVTAGRRLLTGVAVPYGVASGPTTNGRRYRFHAPPNNLDERVDVVREHDPDAVVGRLAEWQPGLDGLGAAARLFTTSAGTDALIEASEQVRTGFSIGADAIDVELGADGVYDVREWSAYHLALVRKPAIRGAVVTRIAASTPAGPDDDEHAAGEAGDTNEDDAEPATADPDDPDAASTEDDDTNEDEDEDDMTETIEASATVPTEHRARRASTLAARGPRTLDDAIHSIAASAQRLGVVQGETDVNRVNAALADVVPGDGSNGLAGAFLRPEWLGELWTPADARRPMIDAIGSRPLTGMTWQGWKWETLPEVEKYTGNKTPIPSNEVVIVPETGTAYRVAGGWDVDRIFIDLGSPDFVAALLDAAAADYSKKSEQFVAADVLAGATARCCRLMCYLARRGIECRRDRALECRRLATRSSPWPPIFGRRFSCSLRPRFRRWLRHQSDDQPRRILDDDRRR